MTDFNIDDFQTFDIQKRRQELANPPVSQAVLDARAKTAQMVQDYNRLNQFVALATGRRAGAPMEVTTYSDAPTSAQTKAADEQAAREFMRSLEKIQQQLGRPLKESEIPAIVNAYGLGSKGLAIVDKYFKYIGRTEEQERAVRAERRAIESAERAVAAEKRAARGEKRAEIKFTQEQEEKRTRKQEELDYDLLVNQALRQIRAVRDGEGFAHEGGQVSPVPPGLTFAAQQKIFDDAMLKASQMGLDPDVLSDRLTKLIAKAPTTKQVLDTQTGKMVFRSDREIANERDRYTPLQTDRGKLSTSAELAAIMALSELPNISHADRMKALQLMEELGPLGAMQQNSALAPLIQQIAVKMKQNQNLLWQLLGKSMQNPAGNSELVFPE